MPYQNNSLGEIDNLIEGLTAIRERQREKYENNLLSELMQAEDIGGVRKALSSNPNKPSPVLGQQWLGNAINAVNPRGTFTGESPLRSGLVKALLMSGGMGGFGGMGGLGGMGGFNYAELTPEQRQAAIEYKLGLRARPAAERQPAIRYLKGDDGLWYVVTPNNETGQEELSPLAEPGAAAPSGLPVSQGLVPTEPGSITPPLAMTAAPQPEINGIRPPAMALDQSGRPGMVLPVDAFRQGTEANVGGRQGVVLPADAARNGTTANVGGFWNVGQGGQPAGTKFEGYGPAGEPGGIIGPFAKSNEPGGIIGTGDPAVDAFLKTREGQEMLSNSGKFQFMTDREKDDYLRSKGREGTQNFLAGKLADTEPQAAPTTLTKAMQAEKPAQATQRGGFVVRPLNIPGKPATTLSAEEQAKAERIKAGLAPRASTTGEKFKYLDATKDGQTIPLQIPENEYNATIQKLVDEGFSFSKPTTPVLKEGADQTYYRFIPEENRFEQVPGMQGKQDTEQLSPASISTELRDISSEIELFGQLIASTGKPYQPTKTQLENLQMRANRIGYAIEAVELTPPIYDQRNWLGMKREKPIEETPGTYGYKLVKNKGQTPQAAQPAVSDTSQAASQQGQGTVKPGTPLDAKTAKFILDSVGGDKEKARQKAKELGYSF